MHTQDAIKTTGFCTQRPDCHALNLELSGVGRVFAPLGNSPTGKPEQFAQDFPSFEVLDSFGSSHIGDNLSTLRFNAQHTKTKKMPNQGMELKDRIREAMEGAGLKPLQLAVKTGKTSGAVTHWLTGATKSLKAETASLISSATGYNAQWLVTGKGDKLIKNDVGPRRLSDGLSPGALEIGALYDMIPVGDQIKRIQAYNAATTAILAVMRSSPASVEPAPRQKKQRT